MLTASKNKVELHIDDVLGSRELDLVGTPRTSGVAVGVPTCISYRQVGHCIYLLPGNAQALIHLICCFIEQ